MLKACIYRKNIVCIEFGTICSLRHPWGSWNIAPADNGWGTTVLLIYERVIEEDNIIQSYINTEMIFFNYWFSFGEEYIRTG